MLPPALAVPTVTYKLFLAGRSGVGKTALVAWLGGTPAPPAHHETLGTAWGEHWAPRGPAGDGPSCPRTYRGHPAHQDTLGKAWVRGPGGDGPSFPCRDRGHPAVLAGQAPRQRPPRPVPAAPLGLRGRSSQEVRAPAARERGTHFGVGDTSRTPQ